MAHLIVAISHAKSVCGGGGGRTKRNNDFEKSPATTNTHEPLAGARSRVFGSEVAWQIVGALRNLRFPSRWRPAAAGMVWGERGAWWFLYRPDAVNNGQLRMVGRSDGH